jgi:phage FluMu protein Com
MLTFACSACQKMLSIKEDLAGKKVKCPGCGQVQPAAVPSRVGTATMDGPPTLPPDSGDSEAPTPAPAFGFDATEGNALPAGTPDTTLEFQSFAVKLFQSGASQSEITVELEKMGLDRPTAEVIAAQAMPGYKPDVSRDYSVICVVVGGIMLIGGVALYIGNRTGLFPTFPFAGHITGSLGVVLLALSGVTTHEE